MKRRLSALAFCTCLHAAFAAPECVTCHPAEVKLHERTRMAHAMLPALRSAFAEHATERTMRESAAGYQFTYQRTAAGLAVVAERGADTAQGIIEWVLGAGAQGQTPLVRTSNGTLESRVSYFPQLQTYGVTIGQASGASPDAAAALGLKENAADLESCIGCHSSASAPALVPGVQCQRCHSGAEEHARGKGQVSNPGKMTPLEQVRFCGNCHRVQPPVDDAQLENVRFQPLRLMKSRCFTSGRLVCTTCHAAHEDARRNDPGFYNAKCQQCHAGQQGDCIGCHMPVVQLHPALRFTDHYIRVTGSF